MKMKRVIISLIAALFLVGGLWGSSNVAAGKTEVRVADKKVRNPRFHKRVDESRDERRSKRQKSKYAFKMDSIKANSLLLMAGTKKVASK